jgi:hypothetical protein
VLERLVRDLDALLAEAAVLVGQGVLEQRAELLGRSGSSCRRMQRESSGVTSEKYGFSVVAPISVTVPSSTAGSRTSCCAFDHRWTSSTNSTVRNRPPLACSITLRASATPEETAESCTSWAPTASASRYASVVLPVPAGPTAR